MNKSTRKNLISGLITVLILFLGFLINQKLSSMKTSTVQNKATKQERRKVALSTYQADTYDNSITIDGRLRAVERVNISPKVQGILSNRAPALREGKYYKKGTLLFSVEDDQAALNVKAQRGNLFSQITQLMADIRFDYPEAFDGWNAYVQEFDVNKSTPAFPEPKSDKEKFFIAGRNIYNLFYSIKAQEANLRDFNVYAPFSGVVTSVNAYPGAAVNPGQVLATMINTSSYEISAPIPLEQLKYVKVGQGVKMESDDLGKTWSGKVVRIGTQIDPNTQNIPIYIGLNGNGLKDGIYLKGELTGRKLENVVRIPKSVMVSPEEVYLVKDSTIVTQRVDVIKRDNDHVLIEGLTPDMKVISGSLAGLFAGQKVTY